MRRIEDFTLYGVLISRSSFVILEKGKMLDPSGCFYYTTPRITVRVLLGLEQNLAGLVVNTIANKLYFD